jgi:hypothetical protein
LSWRRHGFRVLAKDNGARQDPADGATDYDAQQDR